MNHETMSTSDLTARKHCICALPNHAIELETENVRIPGRLTSETRRSQTTMDDSGQLANVRSLMELVVSLATGPT